MPVEPQVPPAGEEIHLPGPSLQPLLVTIGVTVLLIGVTTSPVLLIAGILLTAGTIVRWVQDCKADIDELPLDHHH